MGGRRGLWNSKASGGGGRSEEKLFGGGEGLWFRFYSGFLAEYTFPVENFRHLECEAMEYFKYNPFSEMKVCFGEGGERIAQGRA